VEIGRHIREHRERMGLSQEELAERIYVSRQTISNWETGRTYPDIHSLLLLSILFAVTIDELVRGDVEKMKKTVDETKMKVWSRVMLVLTVVGLLSIAPAMKLLGNWGFLLSIGILVAACAASAVVERIKRRNNIQTYSEILSFMNGSPRDEERIVNERRRLASKRLVMAVASGALGATFALVSLWLIS
jgi:transcriptional regulator with XRE-family HTH domain